jgi:hypothetical protein
MKSVYSQLLAYSWPVFYISNPEFKIADEDRLAATSVLQAQSHSLDTIQSFEGLTAVPSLNGERPSALLVAMIRGEK